MKVALPILPYIRLALYTYTYAHAVPLQTGVNTKYTNKVICLLCYVTMYDATVVMYVLFYIVPMCIAGCL